MSGIAGVIHLDGGPVDVLALHRMGEALALRGPDGVSYWHSGPVGFAHAQFWTTPESLHEQQPLCSPDGRLWLTFDGRIDNREEILQSLRSHGVTPFDHTDPGLILAAYRLWETECLQRIVGDFAFALWDQRDRKLWCARDPIGIRPFFYVHARKCFLFASDIQSLLTHPAVTLAINEGVVAEYLAFALSSRDETLYRDIQRLPSSSTLSLTCDGDLRLTSWWRPDFSSICYRSDAEYAEHFTHLLEQSVSARMRVHGGWGCQLSGGLDSSTVAATAQTLLDRAGAGLRVQTFSTVAPGRPWDESDYVGDTAAFCNLETHCLPPVHVGLSFYREEAARYREFPGFPNAAPLFAGVYRAARDRSVRVLLAGHGGNHLLEGDLSHLADFAMQGSLVQLARVGRNDWEIYGGVGNWYAFVIRKTLLNLAPMKLRAWRTGQNLIREIPLSAGYIRRTQLADRIQACPRPDVSDFDSWAQRSIFHKLQDGEMLRAQEIMDRICSRHGIEERHPFLDRRVVEFCLRIPEDQRQRGTFWKWVIRIAMRNKLPASVLQRNRQAEFSEFFRNAVSEPEARSILAALPSLTRTDWIDISRVRAILSDRELSAHLAIKMWMFLGIELWLETIPDFGRVGNFGSTS